MKIIKKNHSKWEMKGEITFRAYDQTTLNPLENLWNRFVEMIDLNRKKYYILGRLKRVMIKKNVICNVGLNVFARILANDNTYTGNVNKMALGLGTGSFDGTEDALYNEDYRNDIASFTSSGVIAYLTAYYTETECDGNYTEFGNFIDGGVGADSGQLFSHVSVSWNKSNTEAWVVDCKYTLASA